ncbi:copper resistance protein B [Congregibacter sp.]|uniref:copper resistance protein B n=1 Tax=Congregibacter sp. TaxID=2744308 RepID=UPI00385D22FB
MIYRTVFVALGGIFLSQIAHGQTAADAFYDPTAMAEARAALKAGHGNQSNSLLIAERLEFSSSDSEDALVWEAQGWLGTDTDKLWIKTEGESVSGAGLEEAELQLLYSKAVSPFWDIQAGVRHDIEPSPNRSYLVIGAQGLAPYWFELDTAIFLSDEGDFFLRFEAEYELFLTQRLILQPRVELNIAASADEAIGIGKGFYDSVAELRLRYEVRREFAPYVGVSWGGDFNDTAELMTAEGNDAREFAVVAGFRIWF